MYLYFLGHIDKCSGRSLRFAKKETVTITTPRDIFVIGDLTKLAQKLHHDLMLTSYDIILGKHDPMVRFFVQARGSHLSAAFSLGYVTFVDEKSPLY